MAAQCLREAGRVLGNTHDAEEAAQEALLRAWRYRQSLRSQEQRRAWLSVIARNAALHYSAEISTRAAELNLSRTDVGADDPRLSETVDRLAFDSLLAPFDAQSRELLVLRYVEDLAYHEVARRTGLPEGTVKVRLHRLRGRVKILIEERNKRA